MAGSPRQLTTRDGMVPNLQPITLAEGGLTVQQLASITDTIGYLVRAVNGRIGLGDGTHSSQSGNIDGHTKTVYFVAADTDFEVPHGLGRTPIGIIVLSVDGTEGSQVVDGLGNPVTIPIVIRACNQGSWGPTRLYVRCNVSDVTARLVVV